MENRIDRSVTRCEWNLNDALLTRYHDEEWGVPLHDDRMLFEFLALDGMQAGLSWNTILRKRENFRQAFDHFEIEVVAGYTDAKIQALLADAGIVRNKAKINAIIQNARHVLEIQQELGSLDAYLWSFTGGVTVQNGWQTLSQIPATSPISDAMSKDMVARGFKFCGSTILYAFMQAAGMINDHIVTCFRYKELYTG
ncbi:MAG: DNA-3-methyladenine glycosylase I [Chloroflexi bacterium]|jgi:DNA-3-methyladenine glycosylase I|nr:DNA-3-methyladenine glycosylase I [Anaerolineaceae bacterium]NMB89261.1 DNA-3-methyladenine glycosylase I [Chloroflexota bacterium]